MPKAPSARRHVRRRKILKAAKGYWGRRSKLFRPAKDAVAKALVYAYRDRRRRRRDFRTLWITRISAACRAHGTRYSVFMHGLARAEVRIDRKALSNLAIEDPAAFERLVETALAALAEKQAAGT
jgi:large subunit ribosomal protein L20